MQRETNKTKSSFFENIYRIGKTHQAGWQKWQLTWDIEIRERKDTKMSLGRSYKLWYDKTKII